MRVAFFIEVDGPSGAPVGVHFDAMNVGIGADFTAAGALGDANGGNERTGFGADFATEAETKATLDTSAAPRTGLGKNGHGSWERMPAELARGTFKEHPG